MENLREAIQDDIIVFMAQFVEGVDASDHNWLVNKLCSIVVDCFEEFENWDDREHEDQE